MSLILPPLKRVYSGNERFELKTPELKMSDSGYICIIGKNGSGKSSFGEALASYTGDHNGQSWFFLPQYLERFLFAENMLEQMKNLLSQEINSLLMMKQLEDMGFSDPQMMLEFPFILMSGGERRRIALACIFYLQPELLILDEPNIGVTVKENMVLLTKINNLQAMNTRVILISHDHEFVKGSSDLICLKAGRIDKVGSTQKLLADPTFEIKDYGVRF